MKNIGIIYGGYSSEVVVSSKSAEGIHSFIDTLRYKVFKVLITPKKWVVVSDDSTVFTLQYTAHPGRTAFCKGI
jgi:D-alanine-D-alanine ligase